MTSTLPQGTKTMKTYTSNKVSPPLCSGIAHARQNAVTPNNPPSREAVGCKEVILSITHFIKS